MEYYTVMKRNTLILHWITHNGAEWKKLDVKEYVLYDFTHIRKVQKQAKLICDVRSQDGGLSGGG